jgi:hypothetical protein
MLNGCGKDVRRPEYDVSNSSYKLVISSPEEMEEKVRGFNQLKNDYCNDVTNCLGAYHDEDRDQVEDLYFMAGSFNQKDGFCLGSYSLRSSELRGTARETYVSQLEQLSQAKGGEAEREVLSKMYHSLSYPVTMHKVLNCSSGAF